VSKLDDVRYESEVGEVSALVALRSVAHALNMSLEVLELMIAKAEAEDAPKA